MTIINPYHGGASESFVFLTLIFFTLSIATITLILVSRIVKNREQRRKATLLSSLHPCINALLFHDAQLPAPSYSFNINEIKKVIGNDRLATQILVDQIVSLKKNLSGSSAKVLDQLYRDLGLSKFSSRKLSSWSGSRRAQGIRELSELNVIEVLERIPKLTTTNNKTLKEELLLSTIRLDKANPLGFLDQWEGEITPWMQIHIHHYLSQLGVRAIPDFRRWYSSERDDIVSFAISMTVQFQQANTASDLLKLLHHKNHEIVALALKALTDLEAFAVFDQVTSIIDQCWPDEKTSRAIVCYIGKTGTSAEHFSLLRRYLNHESHQVRLEAVSALMQSSNNGREMLESIAEESTYLKTLISHASEPLLR